MLEIVFRIKLNVKFVNFWSIGIIIMDIFFFGQTNHWVVVCCWFISQQLQVCDAAPSPLTVVAHWHLFPQLLNILFEKTARVYGIWLQGLFLYKDKVKPIPRLNCSIVANISFCVGPPLEAVPWSRVHFEYSDRKKKYPHMVLGFKKSRKNLPQTFTASIWNHDFLLTFTQNIVDVF